MVLSSSFTCLQELLTFVINIIKFYFDVSSLLIWNLYTLVNLHAFDFISRVLLIRNVFGTSDYCKTVIFVLFDSI